MSEMVDVLQRTLERPKMADNRAVVKQPRTRFRVPEVAGVFPRLAATQVVVPRRLRSAQSWPSLLRVAALLARATRQPPMERVQRVERKPLEAPALLRVVRERPMDSARQQEAQQPAAPKPSAEPQPAERLVFEAEHTSK